MDTSEKMNLDIEKETVFSVIGGAFIGLGMLFRIGRSIQRFSDIITRLEKIVIDPDTEQLRIVTHTDLSQSQKSCQQFTHGEIDHIKKDIDQIKTTLDRIDIAEIKQVLDDIAKAYQSWPACGERRESGDLRTCRK